MSKSKRYLHLPDACKLPDIPWTATELRRRIFSARPRYNSRGELVNGPSNDLLLNAVMQEKPGGPIWIDLNAIRDYIEACRQGSST